jgi:hypothetical protein
MGFSLCWWSFSCACCLFPLVAGFCNIYFLV